ncbi:MAG: hypothetical protein JJ863_05295 [Deltaproteobacteria bacterium]|nr:hypothetical protein [Deltaproteobacteria bacterium]
MLPHPADAEVSLVSRVDIWVLGFDPGWSESPSDGLRRVFGIDTQEALTLELTVPTPVKRVQPMDAAKWMVALRSIGAECEERPEDSSAPPAFDLPEPKVSVPKPAGGGDVPPGVVMPSGKAQARAKAKAEIAALSSKKKPPPPPPKPKGAGAVKEEVHRVIRTPSMPQDRRPPPQRKASTPAILLDEEEIQAAKAAAQPSKVDAAADEFGELDLGDVRARAAERKVEEERRAKARKDASEPQLELADVAPPRHRKEPESRAAQADQVAKPVVEGPSKGKDLAIGGGLVVLGLGALYFGIMRFESAFLGTGSYPTWALEGVGIGALLFGLLHLVLTLAGREPELAVGKLVGAAVVGFGIAYGVAFVQGANADVLRSLQSGTAETRAVRDVLNDPKARLVGSTEAEGQAIVDAALEGGAISVEVGHEKSLLGRTVAHVLVIEMPASGGARAHMAALIRRALGADRAALAADVPSGERWAIPLR